MGNRFPNSTKRGPSKKWTNAVASKSPRQATQQGEKWRAEQNQRWGDGQEQQVLNHMGRKQQTRERIKRRSNGEPKRRESTDESD
jgi:hypothetical protein